jgi:DNA modification methylase
LLLPWQLTKGAVYNADCLDLLAAIRDESVDTVFADPPFNLAKDYRRGKEKDDLENCEYLHWCYRWMLRSCLKQRVTSRWHELRICRSS